MLLSLIVNIHNNQKALDDLSAQWYKWHLEDNVVLCLSMIVRLFLWILVNTL